MTPQPYRRKPKTFAEDGDDPALYGDSGWDEGDAELAKGAPLEALGPENNLPPEDAPWWRYGQVENSPIDTTGSYAQVDAPDGAKGISAKGAPLTDAALTGDTTPDAVEQQQPSTWERYREAESHMPTMGHAPWYMDLASRAAGAAAGWTNAAGRIRNPIDVNAVREGVLHPGFARKEEEFQSGMAPIRAELAAEMGQREQSIKQLDMQSQAEQRHNQGQMAAARGHWYEAQAGQKWQVDHQAGVIYNKDTGQLSTLPNSNDPVAVYQQVLKLTGDKEAALTAAFPHARPTPQPKALNPMQQAQDILLHPNQHAPEEVANATALTRKQFAPPRAGAGKSAGPIQFRSIESNKNNRLNQIENQANTALAKSAQAKAAGQPFQNPDAINAQREASKSRVQAEYQSEINAITGRGPAQPAVPVNRPPLSQILGR